MAVKINNETYFRTGEICKLTGISKNTLLRWIKNNTFSIAGSRDRRGWRLFNENDLKRLKEEVNRLRIDA